VKDIFAATKARRGRDSPEYPEGYPFEYLLEFSQDCKYVVSFFSYHHQIKAKPESAKQEKLPSLVQPAATRWGTLKACFESLLKSETILHSIFSAREFINGNAKQKASRTKVFSDRDCR
jgi:hypothetical protein